jgi:hypothetical protein
VPRQILFVTLPNWPACPIPANLHFHEHRVAISQQKSYVDSLVIALMTAHRRPLVVADSAAPVCQRHRQVERIGHDRKCARLFAQLREEKSESRFLVTLQVGLRPLLGFASSDRSASILRRSAPGQRI